ncbi:MAG: asparagine synthase (glutamine-hydrolyzing) [Acidobacteria bacterium]|nr:asparagine synthase (glutamine-hydrolyzing) [Acidobacteriota bacterium]
MCGISGIVNTGDRDVLERMSAIQAHRGPDDLGLWEWRGPDGTYVGLGSRRLAIIDLTADGHMPMSNEDASIWITYNGEIYNYASLRQELMNRGHRFTSNTDTEVVLHLYEEEGERCVERLNGMFAFAICDLRCSKPTIFLARDHFGVKPLYYWHDGRRLAFASEVKALLKIPCIGPALDFESLHQYLTFLWVPEPKTMFSGVHKLAAGHHAVFAGDELKISCYWDLNFPEKGAQFARSEEDLVEQIHYLFQRSVRQQMVSDVPIGAFLSAGLDSSSIVACMSQATNRPVRSYTVTFPPKYRIGENTLDNPAVAANLARQLGSENHLLMVEPDVVDLLPRLLWHLDEPLADPAVIAAYLVCREARRDSTVLLSGVGGDELFAGYRRHAAHYWAQTYQRVPTVLRQAVIEPAMSYLPHVRDSWLKGRVRLLKKMARSGSLPARERFIMDCTYLDGRQKANLYVPEISEKLNSIDPTAPYGQAFERVKHADFLNQMLYVDTKIFMTSLNLTYNDKMSMANSIEVRVPFLDRELAEFVAWNVSPAQKLKTAFPAQTKYIFRKALQDHLPRAVLMQPKAGFAAPVDYWLAHELREMVDDLLSESQIRRRALFSAQKVRSLVEEHRAGRADWSMQIWQLLTLEIWMETFLDGAGEEPALEFMPFEQAATA